MSWLESPCWSIFHVRHLTDLVVVDVHKFSERPMVAHYPYPICIVDEDVK